MQENAFKNHKIIFAVILFLVPISQASIDIYSPSLPNITKGLNTNDSLVQQTISLFLVALGIGQFIYGPLSDRYGRKITLFIGMLLFVIGSVICFFSNNISTLIIARFIQGIGAASIAVLSKAVSVDLYSGKELMKATSWVGLVWGLSPIIAPVVGGYLDNYGGWRAPFLFLLIYGIISCFLLIFFMKETNSSYQKINPKVIYKNSVKINSNIDFLCCTIIVAATNLGIFIFSMMAPFFLQNVLGQTPVFFGYMAFIVGIIYAIGAFLSKYAINYFEGEQIIHLTSTVLFITSILMVFFSFIFPRSIFILMLISCVVAFASGFLYPYLVARMFSPFQNQAGLVSSNYGVISYSFSGIASIFISKLPVTSVKQLAYAYALVGIITYVAMKVMFRPKVKLEG